MGQNSSGLGGNGLASPRRKGTVPKPPRPNQPPKIPKTPNHIVPENKVIPNGINDMEKARKLLRPVSQELSKVHPDFADIFQYDPELDFLAGGDESSLERSLNIDQSEKGNSSQGLSNSCSAISNMGNGSLPNGKASLSNGLPGSKSTGDITATDSSTNNKSAGLRRSQSMQRDNNPHPAKYALHKRQASFSNASGVNQSVIVEDPREHLYNITRDQPFSNVMPSVTSLPLENSFGLDYSFNLTYAQLAEYRRQRRTSDLEEKTGKKMSELSAEISANNVVPKSPFDRQAIGAKSGPLSVSTGSSETGVSKSKKKRAPPPPGPPPPQSKVGESDFKIGVEPPVDYDMEDMPVMDFNRRSSSASSNLKKIAPQPLLKRSSLPTLSQTETQSSHRMAIPNTQIPHPPQNSTESIPVSASPVSPTHPSPPPPPPPPPLPPALSQSSSVSTTVTDSKTTTSNKEKLISAVPGHRSLSESVALAKAQLEALKRLEDVLKSPTPAKDKEKPRTDTESAGKLNVTENGNTSGEQDSHHEDIIGKATHNNDGDEPKCDDNNSLLVESVDLPEKADKEKDISQPVEKTTDEKNKIEKTQDTPPVKRMSSLLQHDIVLAAQARGAKVKKAKPPPALEKPLDPSEVFRQELAKAANAREERRRNNLTNGASSGEDMESRSSNSQSNSRSSTPSSRRVSKDLQSTQYKSTEESKINGNGNLQSNQEWDSSSTPLKEENGLVQDVTKSKTELDAEFLAHSFSNHPKQPSIHSEDMSISSGNSQRIFSPSWVPEDDLDSDDDIKAEDYFRANQSSRSEGFKSSIIPSRMKDLKTGKKEKKRQFIKNKETNETSTERRKLESVRKLKDSVQSSMKNAFGSISRASGKLLKKHKSQDFLDTRESDYSVPSPRAHRRREDEVSNWELASSYDGSLRRSQSDANVMHSEFTDGDAGSELWSDAESDVGDIDFSTGLNEMTVNKKKEGSKSNGKPVTDTQKDKKLNLTKLFNKKDTPASSNIHGDDALSREIREKERLLNLEKQKQQEIEKSFRRLQDLEAQERLQRIQTANMRHQITMLQQHQMRQAHAELNNSSMGISAPSISNSQIPQSTQLANSGLMSTSSLDFAPLASMPNPVSASNLGFSQHQSPRHMDLTKDVFGRNVPVPIMSSTFNASQFATHSGPIIGGSHMPPAMPNLTNQELGYLSEYMRVMGVQPPSTQQQWALLLSTVRMNAPAHSQSFGMHQSPMHPAVPLKNNGPDLSRFLGTGKRLEDTLLNISQPDYPGLMNHSYPVRPFDSSYNNLNDYASPGGYPTRNSPFITDALMENTATQESVSKGGDSITTSTELHLQKPSFVTINSSTAATTENGLNSASETKMDTSMMQQQSEERMDLPTSHGDPNGNDTNQLKDGNTPMSHQASSFPSKAYGPIGFRPVSFSAGAAAT